VGCHNGKWYLDHVMYWVAGYTYRDRYRIHTVCSRTYRGVVVQHVGIEYGDQDGIMSRVMHLRMGIMHLEHMVYRHIVGRHMASL